MPSICNSLIASLPTHFIQIEAEVYKGGMQHKTWEQLPSISANVILAAGADSNVYSQGIQLKLALKVAKFINREQD